MTQAPATLAASAAGGSSHARSVASALLLAGSIGLVFGVMHAGIILVRGYGLGLLTWHSRDVIWMAPLANAVIFAALGLLAGLAALLFRKRIPPHLLVGASAFLACFTLLLPFGGIARWAAALLSLGLAVQLARLVRRHPERWGLRLVRAAAILAVLAAGLGLGQRGLLALRRSLALGSLSPPPSGAPNILFIILDTVRERSLSLYGYDRPTSPALEKWATRGVVFRNAFVTAPWTLPSHGSFLSGQWPDRIGGSWTTPVRIPGPTLAEVLRSRGYRTAGFVDNLGYTTEESGIARGFDDYQSYPITLKQVMLHAPIAQTGLVQALLTARGPWYVREALRRFDLSARHLPGRDVPGARAITDGFLRWQEGIRGRGRGRGRPFFAFLNYFDAHGPYRAPAEFQARFARGKDFQDRYDAAIAYLDNELDRLLTTLDAQGVLSRTVVVVSSDHGELFGEHGLKGHSNSLYLPLLQVPLVLLYPDRVPAGLWVTQPVSLRNIPATVLDLALGSDTSGLPGTSLAALWSPAAPDAPVEPAISHLMQGDDPGDKALNARTWLESILDDQYHYIRSGLGSEELYAWRADSLEQVNLAASPEGREIIRQLRARLEAERGPADP